MKSRDVPQVAWSDDVCQADWIRERLADSGVGSVVPVGFPAYARLLHPVRSGPPEDRIVRWAEVAAWSGRPLRPDSEFHSIAFPVDAKLDPRPWRGQGPINGTLDGHDAAELVAILRSHSTTPDTCWFCLWEGRGWMTGVVAYATTDAHVSPTTVPSPIPESVLTGPRVQLPDRGYLLFSGPVEAGLAFVDSEDQTANLFWPSDHSWCVASEIDLSSTYVGGSRDLVDQLLASDGLEALPAEVTAPILGIEPWIEEEAARAAQTLLSSGTTTIRTTAGTVEASLTHYGIMGRKVALAIRGESRDGSRRNYTPLGNEDPRDEVQFYLERAMIALVE